MRSTHHRDGGQSAVNDELYDEKAFVCTDCLFLIANGDMPNYEYQYPEKTEAECEEMTRDYRDRIERTMHGFNITLGWGREQHDCASNVTVTPLLNLDSQPTIDIDGKAREYHADTVSEAIEAAEFDFPGVKGFKGIMHDLETEGDRGGECECETDNFATRDCDHCGDHFAGTWHAATIWKITEENA
jgi:hypothetical protein